MNESWQRVEAVLDEALERDSAEWPALLERLCGDDPELRREVESLLGRYEGARHFLESPAGDLAGGLEPLDPGPELGAPPPGSRIGPYRVLHEIGRGGMGRVLLAERADGQFEQRVALKLLRSGVETGEARWRLLVERQILASLNHSNIARLLDGGVTERGEPYLALEHVEGRPLDDYCDERRLSLEARLQLFLVIADAVEYAHRRLIVHRDLKPGNILVTANGQVKLLDFGIAKLLAEEDAPFTLPATRAGRHWMTPEYAAPEQIRGEPVTTATDVYQLGVLLYELLVGRRPFERNGGGRPQVERDVLERDPEKPSTAVTALTRGPPSGAHAEGKPAEGEGRVRPVEAVSRARSTRPERLRRALRGDLDAITLKALRKEPELRYPSAATLRADIQRHLAGLPVEARRGTRMYRARKFVRRHRWGLASAATILLLLTGAAATATLQARQVRLALEQARLEAAKAEQATGFLLGLFEASRPEVSRGVQVTARDLLAQGAERADGLSDQPELQAQLLGVTGRAYRSLGLYAEAEPLLERALALHRSLHGDAHEEVARSLNALAGVLQEQGRYEEAEPLFREALALRRALLPAENEDVAESLNNLGLLLMLKGGYQAAEPLYREALSIVRSRADAEPDLIATHLNNLAGLLRHTGDADGAERLYREALDRKREAHGAMHPRTALGMSNLANVLIETGNYEEAGRLHEEALRAYRTLYGDEHPDVSVSLYSIGVLRLRQGALEEAEEAFRRTLEMDRRVLGDDHPDVAHSLIGLARVHLARGEAGQAETLLADAVHRHLGGFSDEHQLLAQAKGWLGTSLMAQGRFGEAEPLLQTSHTALEGTRGGDDPLTRRALEWLLELYDAMERPELAARYRSLLEEPSP